MSSPIDTASVAIVPDLSGFIREVSRGIDAALRGVVGDVRQAFSQVERAASQAGADVGREFQQGGESAERALREVSSTAKREFREVETSAAVAGAGISAKLGGALALVRTGLLAVGVGAAAGLAAMTGFGLKAAAEMEQTQVAFNSLLGSVEEGTRVLNGLKEFAAITPFELPEITGAAQRFLAFNEAIGLADSQLQPFLTTLGNIASVTGGGADAMSRVTLALGQIASRGKVSLEEINQISEALPGFSGVAAIAAATGQSTADTMEQISAGALDATTGVAALLAGMDQFPGAAGAMEKQSQTLLGVFSTFKDTLSQAMIGAFQPVIPEIKGALSELTPVLGSAIGELAPALGGLLSSVLPLIGKLIKAIVPILTPLLDALGPALDALGPALEPLGQALGEIMVALAPILPLLGQFLGASLQLLVPVLLLIATILKPLTPLIEFLTRAIAEFGKALSMIDWEAVGRAIANFFVNAWNSVLDFFQGIGEWFGKLPGMARDAFQAFHNAIMAKVDEVIAFVQALPGRVIDAIGDFAGLLVQKGKDLIFGLWNGISSLGGWLWQKVKDFAYANTVGAFKTALGIGSPSTVMAEQVGRWLPPGVVEGAQSELGGLRSMLNGMVGELSPAAATGGLGGVIINVGGVHFTGVTPTPDEAHRTGQQVGAGIADALARRNIALAVRMV